MSETTQTGGKLAAALAKAQGSMTAADKDAKGNYGKYATLAAIMDAVRAPLSANGIAYVQMVSAEGNNVTVTTRLMHESGESIESALTSQAIDASPQKIGSVVTYLRRYTLAAMAGIAPDDDDDGQSQQPPSGRHEQRPRAAAKTVTEPTASRAEPQIPAEAKARAKDLVNDADTADRRAHIAKLWKDAHALGVTKDEFAATIAKVTTKAPAEWTWDDVKRAEHAVAAFVTQKANSAVTGISDVMSGAADDKARGTKKLSDVLARAKGRATPEPEQADADRAGDVLPEDG